MVRIAPSILQASAVLNVILIYKTFSTSNNPTIVCNNECKGEIRAKLETNIKPKYVAGNWEVFTHFVLRGDFWVGYNAVPANKNFVGNESITLTTPSDHASLDNLITLVHRWHGPISCAIFAPGTDYPAALQTIHYLRVCTSALIQELVTFHLFFPRDHIPDKLHSLTWASIESLPLNCGIPLEFGERVKTYRKFHKLPFPINVARNIARESARTHFVMASDIELYPSPNIIPGFLEMVSNTHNPGVESPHLKVFVLPVFELSAKVKSMPNTIKELRDLFEQKLAIPFHKFICRACHSIPNLPEWMAGSGSTSMDVFTIVKRTGEQRMWEPFYIGTKLDPVFHERVTWEGRSNKRIQAYALCLLDYEFHILSGAFLVHRPGVKHSTGKNTTIVREMDALIRKTIAPELKSLYGVRSGCTV